LFRRVEEKVVGDVSQADVLLHALIENPTVEWARRVGSELQASAEQL
jgi:hypothetical protein